MATTEELFNELQKRQASYKAKQQGVSDFAPSGYAKGQGTTQEQLSPVPQPINDYNVEEMHEAVSFIHRWTVKNLSINQKASVAFLQEKYPELEFEYDGSRIYMRDKGNKEKFFVLDPSTMSLAEMVGDMGDVVADVVAGVTTAIAAVLGGLTGAVLTGDPKVGVGTGAVSAGVMGATTDMYRQKMGAKAGIPQDPSLWEAFKTGLIDAAGTVIGGTGAPIKNIIRGVGKNSGKELMKQGSKKNAVRMLRGGLAERYGVPLRRGITDKIGVKGASKLAEPLTGLSQKQYQRYINRPNQMKEIAETGPANYVEQKLRGAYRGLENKEAEVGKMYQDLGRPGEIVDISDVKKALDDEIKKLEKVVKNKVELPKIPLRTQKKQNRLNKKALEGKLTPSEKAWMDEKNIKMTEAIEKGQKGSKEIQRETLRKYKELRDKAFTKDVNKPDPVTGMDNFQRMPESDQVPYDRAMEIKKELTDSTGKYREAINQTGDEPSKAAERQAKKLKNNIEKKIQDSVGGSREARDEYINTKARKQDFIERYKDKPDEYIPSDEMVDIANDTYFSEKGTKTLKKMSDEPIGSSPLRDKTSKIDEKIGSDLVNVADDISAYDIDTQAGKGLSPYGDVFSRLLNTVTGGNIGNPKAWKKGMQLGREGAEQLRDKLIVPTGDMSVKRRALGQTVLDDLLWGDSPDRSPEIDEYGDIIEYDREGRIINQRLRSVPPMNINSRP